MLVKRTFPSVIGAIHVARANDIPPSSWTGEHPPREIPIISGNISSLIPPPPPPTDAHGSYTDFTIPIGVYVLSRSYPGPIDTFVNIYREIMPARNTPGPRSIGLITQTFD